MDRYLDRRGFWPGTFLWGVMTDCAVTPEREGQVSERIASQRRTGTESWKHRGDVTLPDGRYSKIFWGTATLAATILGCIPALGAGGEQLELNSWEPIGGRTWPQVDGMSCRSGEVLSLQILQSDSTSYNHEPLFK
jgi:hypothetical protein